MLSYLLFLNTLVLCLAHSWVERLNVLRDGVLDMQAGGYIRGNIRRTEHGFSDAAMVYLLPPNGRTPHTINDDDSICRSTQQPWNQTALSPRLSARSGDSIRLQWSENGHITKPWNNPPSKDNTGLVFVYGTVESQATDAFNSIHWQWTPTGTGGDQRGRMLAAMPFDNLDCYQFTDASSGLSPIESERAARNPRPGSADPEQGRNLWCTVDVSLPTNLPDKTIYTLYWVWDWPTEAAGSLEWETQVYTSCMDIDIIV